MEARNSTGPDSKNAAPPPTVLERMRQQSKTISTIMGLVKAGLLSATIGSSAITTVACGGKIEFDPTMTTVTDGGDISDDAGYVGVDTDSKQNPDTGCFGGCFGVDTDSKQNPDTGCFGGCFGVDTGSKQNPDTGCFGGCFGK